MKFAIYCDVLSDSRKNAILTIADGLRRNNQEVILIVEDEIGLKIGDTYNYFNNTERLLASCDGQLACPYFVLPSVGRRDLGDIEVELEERRRRVNKLLADENPDKIIVWNGMFDHQQLFLGEINKLGWMEKLIYSEVGWFPQKDTVYFDFEGVNYRSSIPGTRKKLNFIQQQKIDRFKSEYRAKNEPKLLEKRRKTIFVPLQVDTDTSIQRFSPFSSMREFIAFLEGWVPDDYEVLFKLHPKSKYSYVVESQRENFKFFSSGSIFDYIAVSEFVVGINSTVLLECLVLGKPVVAFGRGLYSDTGAVSEVDTQSPFQVPPFNDECVDGLLYHLVYSTQISLDKLRKTPSQLFGYEPFRGSEGYLSNQQVKMNNITRGDVMVHIGNSKISKSASLDVEREGVIKIGNDCEVRHNAVLEVVGRYNGCIEIGNHCVVGVNNWIQGSGRVVIGDDVIMGPNVCIVSTNHKYEDTSVPIARQPLETGEVVIEDDVWIGANATISYNVKVGAHSIIGANSFVNSDVPPYSIVAGSPAKVIKSREKK